MHSYKVADDCFNDIKRAKFPVVLIIPSRKNAQLYFMLEISCYGDQNPDAAK